MSFVGPGIRSLVWGDQVLSFSEIDNIVITVNASPVPEPATLALILGAMGWIGWRQRQRA
jgi:hypothetical protein